MIRKIFITNHNNILLESLLLILLTILAFLIQNYPAKADASKIKQANYQITHAISLTGEIKYPSDFGHFDYVSPKAKKGGEIRLADIGSFDNLNPYILVGTPPSQISIISDKLLVQSSDEIGSAYGLLAESMEIPDDNKFVIFNLRKIAKWHDGSPINADDVVFSFNILREKGNPIYKSIYKDVASVEKLSEYKVKFNFSNPDNQELVLMVGSLPILSKSYYSKIEFGKTTLTPPLTSGPYRIKELDAGKYIIYERVKDYWAKDLPVNVGKYNFDIIRIDYYRDLAVMIQAFKAGAYDIRMENIAKNWATEYNIKQVEDGSIIKREVKHEIPTGMQAFIFNIRKDKFADRNFRKALGYAFDFEWTNKNLFYNSYTRTNSYFSNSEYAASGKISKEEKAILDQHKDLIDTQIYEEIVNHPFSLPKNDGSGNNRTNLLVAMKILEQAGYYIKDGKLIDPRTNKAVEIEFLIDSISFQRVILPIIKNLKKLGIKATIKTVDSGIYQKRLENFDFDMTVSVYAFGLMPGNEQIGYWHSRSKDTRGSSNLVGTNMKILDLLTEKLVNSKDHKELVATAKTLDRILLANYFVIPNWNLNKFRLLYWNKFNKPDIDPKYDLPVIETWYCKC